MSAFIWASLILLLFNSTPTISSPCIEDLPILVLKKSKIFASELFFLIEGDLGSLIPSKDGFFNFIFFNLPNRFENFSFVVEVLFVSSLLILSLVETFLSSILFSTIWLTIGCDGWFTSGFVWTSLSWVTPGEEVSVLDCWSIFCCSVWTTLVWFSSACFFNFSLSAWISSNHFSKIGIASSRFGVPDEEIFCFPSIYSLPTQFFDLSSPLYLSCLIYIWSLPSFLCITWRSCLSSGASWFSGIKFLSEFSFAVEIFSTLGWFSWFWTSDGGFSSLVK